MFRKIFSLFGILLVVLFISNLTANAADRMTFEEYQVQLKFHQDREASTLKEIESEKEKITDLSQQITELESKISAIWEEIYLTIEMTEEEYKSFLDEISEFENRVNSLERLNPEMLLMQEGELTKLLNQINEKKSQTASGLAVPESRLNSLFAKVERLIKAIPKPKNDNYLVIRGDHLWKISGKKQIFNDPWKWMRIYSANREKIKNPDLIYPDQELQIPRQIGRDEHLVVRGEFLSKIAGYSDVYGDPFKWTKIYQANKENGFIQDPSLIYPEQILSIPQN